MTPLVTLVQTTTYEMTPPATRLPPFVWTAFTALNKVHGAWRWYRRIELYRNPENFAQLLAGHATNLIIGDALLLRIAAQCLLISTRMLECVQQQGALAEAGHSWIAAVKGHYPKPVNTLWNTHPQRSWQSPSTIAYWKVSKNELWNRLERIVQCTLHLFFQAFLLSMRIMDAIDAFCLDPHTRNEGINESFVNAVKWLDTLVKNKEQLLQGIVENQAIIERILHNSPFTYVQLRDGIIKTLDKTEKVHIHAKQISEFGNGILIDTGKRMLNGVMVVTGFANFRPLWLAEKDTLLNY